MRWEKLSFRDFDRIDRNTPVLLNIAAIEQHGPHLPLDVDSRIGRHFCDLIDKRMADNVLVLPQIKVCCSRHHMDFAGTLTVSHETLLAYLRDIVACVKAHGFKNLLILNSHGGNQAIGRVAIEAIGPEFSADGGRLAFTSWWDVAAEALMDISRTGPFGVGHACEFETSLMQLIAPEEVRTEALTGQTFETFAPWADADLLRPAPVSLYRSMKDMSAGSGVVGDPSSASAETGRVIVDIVIPALVAILTELSAPPRDD
ncbi:creatininase family protein [Hoeflea sp. TYP-13]|uniref:creatininase family protein n=1 Tax=Hoeflea sp. TYP-13 TaxID=3230023 RepID=UPI0034C69656